jgi:hypothetical protein
MNTILEWLLVGMAVIAVLCGLALFGIWLWTRRDAQLCRDIQALEPRDISDAEADRHCWASFKARMAQEERENKLGRFLGVNRALK